MNLFTKRFGLVLAGVVGVGAIAALVVGASFALFTSQSSTGTLPFIAGSVKLATAATFTCTPGPVTNLEPGDSGSCTATVAYTGSLPAYLGAEATATGNLAQELALTIKGIAQTSYSPVVIGSGGAGTYTATVDYTLSHNAGNAYQLQTAEVAVTFYAVQCSNNLAGDPTAANEGCLNPGPALWSQTAASAISFAVNEGGTAGWTTANDTSITLTVPALASDNSNAGAYAIVEFNNVGNTLPTDAPSFSASEYASGTPRWYIQLGPAATGPYLFGYPGDTWNVNDCAGVDNGAPYTYWEAVTAIALNCGADINDVTSVNIVADTSITAGYTTVLTDIQYNGVDFTS